MINPKFMSKLPIVLTAFAILSGCEPRPKSPVETPPPTTAAPSTFFVFDEEFMKEEATLKITQSRVLQKASGQVHVPKAGRYALTVRAVTASAPAKNTIEVSVNGQAAGKFSTDAFDLTNPVSATIEANLKAG